MSIESEAVAIRKEYISTLVSAVRSYQDNDNADDGISYDEYAADRGLPNSNYVVEGLGGWANAERLARGKMTADDVIDSGRVDIKQILPVLLEAAEDGYTSSVDYQKWRSAKISEGREGTLPSKATIYHNLGSWKNVNRILDSAGLRQRPRRKGMLDKLREALEINGEGVPYTIQNHIDLHESGRVEGLPPYHLYIYNFGSWNEAVAEAGGIAGSRRFSNPSKSRSDLRGRILESMKVFVKDMAEKGKSQVTRQDYIDWYQSNSDHAFVHTYVYSNYPGGWAQAVLDAGGQLPDSYTFRKRTVKYDDRDKLMKYVRRAAKTGKTTYRGYDEWRASRMEKGEEGIPSASTIRVKMNGWTSVLDELRSEGFHIS